MIEVIKPKPKKYIMKCYECDCIFTYELEDIIKTDILHLYKVECPECHTHSYRTYNRVKVEVLENDLD